MTTHTASLVDVKTAAAELGITVRAVQYRIDNGTLAAEKIGQGRTSAYVIARTELDRVKALSVGTPDDTL